MDWRWPAAGVVLAFHLIFVGWLLLKPGGDSALLWFDDISVAVGAFLAGAFSLLAVRRYWGSQTGLAWSFIALGLFLFSFGDGSWAFQEIALGIEVPFPSISDVGYLGAYPAVFLGLLLMPQAPARGMQRAKLTLDVLIGMVAVAVISWNFAVAPLLAEGEGSALADVIGVSYPLADLAIIFAVLVLIARATTVSSTAYLFVLGAAFAATAFSDSLYTYLTQVGDYSTGSYIDIGWLTGYNLVTLSALLCIGPQRRPDARPTESQTASFWRSAALYAGVVPLGALVLLDGETLLTAGVLCVVALMFTRQLLTIHENIALNRQLAELTVDLEVRVKEQMLQLLRSRSGPAARQPGDAATTGSPVGAETPSP